MALIKTKEIKNTYTTHLADLLQRCDKVFVASDSECQKHVQRLRDRRLRS